MKKLLPLLFLAACGSEPEQDSLTLNFTPSCLVMHEGCMLNAGQTQSLIPYMAYSMRCSRDLGSCTALKTEAPCEVGCVEAWVHSTCEQSCYQHREGIDE